MCIQCYRCSYSIDSTGLEGGLTCNDGPWDDSEVPYVFQSYCHPNIPDGPGFDGIHNDFDNLVCHAEQILVNVLCGATTFTVSENDYFSYRIKRDMIVVAAIVDLGPPEFGGYYNLEDDKAATVFCDTPDCNELDIQAPMTARDNHEGDLTCKTCVYTRNTAHPAANFGDENCLTSINNVESGTCGEGEVCSIDIHRHLNEFDTIDVGWHETLSRGCRAHTLSSSRAETMIHQTRSVVCRSSFCNNMQLDVDPDDMGPLPRPGDWDQPINPIEVPLFCGPLQSECTRCLTCDSKLGDEFDICRNKAEFVESHWYRNRYYDDREGQWVNNVCAIQTMELRNTQLNEYPTGVFRGVIQVTDAELANGALTTNYQWQMSHCVGDLCNGVHSLGTQLDRRCFYCVSHGTDNACWSGTMTADMPTEACPTAVCETVRYGTTTKRGCLSNPSIAQRVADVLGTHTQLETLESNARGTRQGCTGTNCNDKYVNVELEILDEPPVYDPQQVPSPIFNVAACDDPNHPGVDTHLCIRCHSCQHVVDSFGEAPDYERCITDLANTEAYFFKSDNGIPTVCGLQTTKTLSNSGYSYFVNRGALRYLDPSLVSSIGPTKVQTYRRTRFQCADDGCNWYPIGMIPIPPMAGPKRQQREARASPWCFTCSYDEVTGTGDPECLDLPSDKLDLLNCMGPNDVCSLDLTEEYRISDAVFQNNDITMHRGCQESTGMPVFDITSRMIDTWVCVGEMCNNAMNEPQMPPYDPLPSETDMWYEPLSATVAATLCEVTECITCLTCDHVYDFQQPYPNDYLCSDAVYKANFLYSEDTSKMVYNHCSVRSGIRENGESNPIRFISHTVTQSLWSELPVENEVEVKVARTNLFGSETKAGTCSVCNNPGECQRAPTRTCTSFDSVCIFIIRIFF